MSTTCSSVEWLNDLIEALRVENRELREENTRLRREATLNTLKP